LPVDPVEAAAAPAVEAATKPIQDVAVAQPHVEPDSTAQMLPVGHDFAAHNAPTIRSRKQLESQIEVLEAYQKPADDDTPPPQIQHITPFTRSEDTEKSKKVNLVQRLINRLRGVS
jgi:hypothetical protein